MFIFTPEKYTVSTSRSFPTIIGWSKIASTYLYSTFFLYNGSETSCPFRKSYMTDRQKDRHEQIDGLREVSLPIIGAISWLDRYLVRAFATLSLCWPR